MILSICSNADILSIFRVIRIVITIVKIVVPIILIISLALNYMDAVKSNDADMLSKANKASIHKIIAALLVFFIPTFVGLLARVSSFDKDSYLNCIKNSSSEQIDIIRIEDAGERINNLESNLSYSNYNAAKSAINKIKDEGERTSLAKKIEELKKYVDIQELLNKLETKKDKNTRKKVKALVDALPDSDPRKQGFLDKLKELGVGEPLNVAEGYSKFYYDGMEYYVYFPKDATTNLPLLLWLHGDNFRRQWAENVRISKTADEAGYPALVLVPFVGTEMGHSVKGWHEGGLLPKVKALTDKVCEDYQCDKNNINIGGHSRGATGTWMMVTRYPNYFHAASPVSCCSYFGIRGESFKGMKVWAIRGTGAGVDFDNDDRYACMQEDVDKVKPYAKEVRYTILPNTTHGDATNELQVSEEYVEFMFSD